MVQPDQYNFGSAPWFLRTHCSKDVQNQLLGGTDAGFAAYMGCVLQSSAIGDDRLAYWEEGQRNVFQDFPLRRNNFSQPMHGEDEIGRAHV